MIFSLLKIVLVFSSTFVISVYAYDIESNDETSVSCQDALAPSPEASFLEAYVVELQYAIGKYNKLSSSAKRRAYELELIEALDGDIKEVSILLDMSEKELSSLWSSANGKSQWCTCYR